MRAGNLSPATQRTLDRRALEGVRSAASSAIWQPNPRQLVSASNKGPGGDQSSDTTDDRQSEQIEQVRSWDAVILGDPQDAPERQTHAVEHEEERKGQADPLCPRDAAAPRQERAADQNGHDRDGNRPATADVEKRRVAGPKHWREGDDRPGKDNHGAKESPSQRRLQRPFGHAQLS